MSILLDTAACCSHSNPGITDVLRGQNTMCRKRNLRLPAVQHRPCAVFMHTRAAKPGLGGLDLHQAVFPQICSGIGTASSPAKAFYNGTSRAGKPLSRCRKLYIRHCSYADHKVWIHLPLAPATLPFLRVCAATSGMFKFCGFSLFLQTRFI